MIKKYNQFVKGINEEFEMGEGQPAPVTRPAEPTTTPDTPTRPRPTRPGITPTEVPSEEDAPLAYGYGDSNDLPEEEGGEYQGQMLLNQLANELGTEVDDDGSINYEGKKINFYSETEKFHVDNKKFSTVEEVVNYLGGSNEDTENAHSKVLSKTHEHDEEPSFDETEGDLARRDLEDEMGAYESKSYRHTRLKKFGK
jgi:hypothetical protein